MPAEEIKTDKNNEVDPLKLTKNEISALTKYVEHMSETSFDKEELINFEKKSLELKLANLREDIKNTENNDQKKTRTNIIS
ncbi:MAG: hypothetical protein ABH808_02760 [Candidatus Kuenenbacteria bacterium]